MTLTPHQELVLLIRKYRPKATCIDIPGHSIPGILADWYEDTRGIFNERDVFSIRTPPGRVLVVWEPFGVEDQVIGEGTTVEEALISARGPHDNTPPTCAEDT